MYNSAKRNSVINLDKRLTVSLYSVSLFSCYYIWLFKIMDEQQYIFDSQLDKGHVMLNKPGVNSHLLFMVSFIAYNKHRQITCCSLQLQRLNIFQQSIILTCSLCKMSERSQYTLLVPNIIDIYLYIFYDFRLFLWLVKWVFYFLPI